MIAHAVDRDSRLVQFSLGGPQFVQIIADFDADMIEPPAAALWRPRSITDLDKQQLMMGPAGGQGCCRTIEDPSDLLETQQIAIERERSLQILDVKYDMTKVVCFH